MGEPVAEDDTDGSAFDQSSGSDYDGQTVSKYQTQMPICIDGMSYDANQIETFVCNAFEGQVDCDDIEIVGVEEGDDSSYSFTAQIHHDTASSVLGITSIAWGGSTEERSEFCDSFEELYSTGSNPVSCTNCYDTITYALYTWCTREQCVIGYGDGGDHDIAVHAVIAEIENAFLV